MNKKIIMSLLSIMMVATFSVCFSSCGDDEDDMIYSLDKSSVTLYVDETSTLTYSGGTCNWSSDNSLIADVSNGVVTAKHVGTTTIHANESSCIVTVKPRYTTYKEPYMNWGASKSEVKSNMSGYTLKTEDTNNLTYLASGNVAGYSYVFKDGKLYLSIFLVELSKSANLSDFLLERYEIIDYEKLSNYEYNFYLGSVDMKTIIVFNVTSSYCAVAYYDVNYLDSSNKESLKKKMRDYVPVD